jgi:uncharacterized membrane protein
MCLLYTPVLRVFLPCVSVTRERDDFELMVSVPFAVNAEIIIMQLQKNAPLCVAETESLKMTILVLN